jgi:hypothetical protein
MQAEEVGPGLPLQNVRIDIDFVTGQLKPLRLPPRDLDRHAKLRGPGGFRLDGRGKILAREHPIALQRKVKREEQGTGDQAGHRQNRVQREAYESPAPYRDHTSEQEQASEHAEPYGCSDHPITHQTHRSWHETDRADEAQYRDRESLHNTTGICSL